jgi:O-antigen/teichoic acid export membrane protein
LIVAPFTFILALLSPWWLGAIFGEEFTTGWIPLSAFLFINTLSVSFIAVDPLFIAMGYVKQKTFIFALANTIYLVTLWLLAPSLGLIGLAIALGFQIILVVGLKILIIQKGLRKPKTIT